MDPVADMITRIRNAGAVRKPAVEVRYSALAEAIAKVLAREAWIENAVPQGKSPQRTIEITLKYVDGAHRISGIRRVSHLGKRVYRGWREIRSVRQGYGMSLISTPQGILSDKEARKKKVGGEVLFEVW